MRPICEVNLAATLSDLAKAAAYLDQGRAVSHSSGDKDGEARALIDYGNLKALGGDVKGSLALYRDALDISRKIPNKVTEALALERSGVQLVNSGDLNGAEQNYSSALAIRRQIGDLSGQAGILGLLGGLARARNDNFAALEHYRGALEIRRAIGDKFGTAVSQLTIAHALRFQGKLEEARSTLAGALTEVEALRQRIVAPQLRMRYFGGLQRFYEEYIDLLMQMNRAARDAGHDRTAFTSVRL